MPQESEDGELDPREPAAAGTIAHAAIAQALRGDPMEIDELPENVRQAVGNALSMWHKGSEDNGLKPLKTYFDGGDDAKLFIEYPIPGDDMGGGTLDVGAYRPSDGTILVLDWKTGHRMGDHTMQLLRYANRLAHEVVPKNAEVSKFALITVYPRLWEWTSISVTPAQADEMLAVALSNAGIAGAMIEAGGPGEDLSAFTEGPHCAMCKGASRCPVKTRLIRRVANVDLPELSINEPLANGEVLDGYLALQWLERAAKELRARLREFVVANGPVDRGDGTSLAVRMTKPVREVDSDAAMYYLPLFEDADGEKVFDRETMPKLCTFSVSKIEAVVKAKAPKGQKAKEWEEIEERLRTLKVIVDGKPTERFEPVANEKLLANNP